MSSGSTEHSTGSGSPERRQNTVSRLFSGVPAPYDCASADSLGFSSVPSSDEWWNSVCACLPTTSASSLTPSSRIAIGFTNVTTPASSTPYTPSPTEPRMPSRRCFSAATFFCIWICRASEPTRARNSSFASFLNMHSTAPASRQRLMTSSRYVPVMIASIVCVAAFVSRSRRHSSSPSPSGRK